MVTIEQVVPAAPDDMRRAPDMSLRLSIDPPRGFDICPSGMRRIPKEVFEAPLAEENV